MYIICMLLVLMFYFYNLYLKEKKKANLEERESLKAIHIGDDFSNKFEPMLGTTDVKVKPEFGTTDMKFEPMLGTTDVKIKPEFKAIEVKVRPEFGTTDVKVKPEFETIDVKDKPEFGTADVKVRQEAGPESLLTDETWCRIDYFELDSRVGPMFEAKTCRPKIIVDGFTNPGNSTDRFSLGRLSNVNRTSEIEDARRHIGKGIELTCCNNGNVFVSNLSDKPIFVRSQNANYYQRFHPTTVSKIMSGCSAKIFSQQDFDQLLAQAATSGFYSVMGLAKMCSIQMSFVKGWGVEYTRQVCNDDLACVSNSQPGVRKHLQ
jgi:hypothetical protein